MTDNSMFEEVASDGPSDSQLFEIKELADKAVLVASGVAELEEALKEQKKELNDLQQNQLPQKMTEIGMEEFKLEDGTKIEIKDYLGGSLPKDVDGKAAALSYIEDVMEMGSIIKRSFQVNFGKGEDEEAGAFRELIEVEFPEFKETLGVNHQTLGSAARELLSNGSPLKDGKPINLDVLGLFAGKAAKVKLPK